MSKATVIRRKALDLVRQQDWQGAIREYGRLVELDQNNPNLHNELADIYLRTGAKSEAYDSFIRAIDEYTRVGLYNNAVAVAKKIMRVLPARTEVLVKLGYVRMKQGLAKEAESYYLSFLEKAEAGAFESAAFQKLAKQIAEDMAESAPVIQRLAECLVAYRQDEEAGNVLIALHVHLQKNGNQALTQEVRARIEKLGFAARLDALATGSAPAPGPGADRTVVTEQNIWTAKHSEGERIEIESTPRFTPPKEGEAPAAAPSEPPAPAAPAGPSERDQYLLRLARGVGGGPRKKTPEPATAPPPSAQPAPAAPGPSATDAAAPETPAPEQAPAAPAPAPAASETPETADSDSVDEAPRSAPAAPPKAPAPARQATKDHMNISALIDDDDAGDPGEDDYRSHYDLGMAYLEMELLAEAIREFQVAAKSPQYQVKCLEMVGLCFIKQNQPQLAIKQLRKGLTLIGDDGDEALGIKYNLGLAYEMVGDTANARAQFEDVYVVDVTFREVSEKIQKLTEDR